MSADPVIDGDSPSAPSDPVAATPSGREPPLALEATPAGLLHRAMAASAEWWRAFRTITTFRAHDTSTEEGRSLERYRRAALTSITSLLAHGLGAGTGLLSVRITLSYLRIERYGLWMAVNSLLTWAALADFGIGRGAQNHLAEAYGQGDRDAAARYASTGFVALGAIAAAIATAFVPALVLVPWTTVLNVQDPSLAAETRQVVGAVVACFLAGFPLSLVPTIYASHQQGYVANLFSIVGHVLSLACVLVATSLGLSLPWLILAMGGTRLFMTAVNLGYIIKEMPWLRPRLSLASRGTMRALAGTSAALLLFQLSSLLINEAQVLIVAQRLGLAKVAEYSIFVSVHTLPIILISTLDGPLMPAFREAHVRGDAKWLRSAFFRITKIKMAIAAVAAGLYFVLGNFAAGLLSHGTVYFNSYVWGASGLLLLVGVWNGSFVDLMIATNRLWFLVALVAANAVGTAGLTYWFSGPGWFPWAGGQSGIFGVVLATPILSIVVTGWLLPWACRDLIRKPGESPPSLASSIAK